MTDYETRDLPKRLRRFSQDKSFNLGVVPPHLLDEAADEIERLRGLLEPHTGVDDTGTVRVGNLRISPNGDVYKVYE